MKAIDVEGLPEPVAQALATIVDMLRRKRTATAVQEQPRQKVELYTWPGKIIGHLTREEIYEDAG